jgi:hypothetical protein
VRAPGWLLKAVATLLTGVAAVASATFVAAHPKIPTAPLQPAVVTHFDAATVAAPDDPPPATSTYVS